MKKKRILAAGMSVLLSVMSVTPVLGGEWAAEGSNWKYYSDNGNMVTGWLEDNGEWYFLQASGNMATGWIKDEGSWYFLYDNGAMAHDTWIDNYYVNSSGKWVKTR